MTGGCRLRVSPMPRLSSDPRNPMHATVATPALEPQPSELSFKLTLRREELHQKALRRCYQTGVVAGIDFMSLLNDSARIPGPLGDGPDGPLEDLAILLHPVEPRAAQ